MIHVAIMKKEYGFVDKILNKEKTVESRWCVSRRMPWDSVRKGDRIYFKISGRPVSACARVAAVEEHEHLTPEKVLDLLVQHSGLLGIEDRMAFYENVKGKKYCIFIFLEEPKKVKPFNISKKGYGMRCAWIMAPSLAKIKA